MPDDFVETIRAVVRKELERTDRIQLTHIRASPGKDLVIQSPDGADLVTIKSDGSLIISATPNRDIHINTAGTGKAYYNDVEIGAGGSSGGDGGGYIDKIIGKGCPESVQQPMVICSPTDAPCDVHVIAGKNGRIVFKRSE